MQPGGTMWNPLVLYDDGDPNNDPNLCFDSPDPSCDWERGWQLARQTHVPVVAEPNPRQIEVRQAPSNRSSGSGSSGCVTYWTPSPGYTCWREASGGVLWRRQLPLGPNAQKTQDALDEIEDAQYLATAFALATSVAKGTPLPPREPWELTSIALNPHTLCTQLRCMLTEAAEEATFQAS